MFFDTIKRGWEARLKLLGISARQFCKDTGISYDTFKRIKNPTVEICDKIEAEIQKREA